jgi:hypothetical protein
MHQYTPIKPLEGEGIRLGEPCKKKSIASQIANSELMDKISHKGNSLVVLSSSNQKSTQRPLRSGGGYIPSKFGAVFRKQMAVSESNTEKLSLGDEKDCVHRYLSSQHDSDLRQIVEMTSRSRQGQMDS